METSGYKKFLDLQHKNRNAEGYISVVPVKFDLTAHEYLQQLGEELNS